MKDVSRYLAPVTVCAMLALPHIAAAQTASAIPPSLITPDKVETRIGPLQFKDGAPSVDTPPPRFTTRWISRGVWMLSSTATAAHPPMRSVRAFSVSEQRTTLSSYSPN